MFTLRIAKTWRLKRLKLTHKAGHAKRDAMQNRNRQWRRVGRMVVLVGVLVLAVLFPAHPASLQATGQKEQLAQGRKLFMQYCASCHGTDGRGNGPVSLSLRATPTDLTKLTLSNGEFPAERLQAVIAGTDALTSHGTREMPVWGGTLRKTEIASLVKYLASIQRLM